MADSLQRMNEYALRIIEKEKLTDGKYIRGQHKGSTFAFKFDSTRIKNYYQNIIHWAIGLWDYASKVVTVLQLVGAKLMSKYTAMEILGTRSPIDEQKRMADEMTAEIKMQKELQEAMVPPVEAEGMRAGPEIGPDGKPINPPAAPSTEIPLEAAKATEEELRAQKGATARKRPKGRPKGRPEAASSERLTLNEVSRALAGIPNLKGDVYIFGGLISSGYTDHDIDLMLTDLRDKATILNQLPQWRGRFSFKKIAKGEKIKGSQLQIKGSPEVK